MRNDESIEVVLASDEGYFIGLYQVIETLVHSAINKAYHVHVIDDGLSEESAKAAEAYMSVCRKMGADYLKYSEISS